MTEQNVIQIEKVDQIDITEASRKKQIIFNLTNTLGLCKMLATWMNFALKMVYLHSL